MQKFLRTLTLLAFMLVPWVTQAQQELTVHDGTDENDYVPVYGYYADAYLRCQIVYPAAELSAMSGGTISGLTFYISETDGEAWDGTFTVKLTEITATTLSAFDESAATTVYTGLLDGSGETMTITFSTPYTYGGGNLLIEVSQTEPSSSYPACTFLGEEVAGASIQSYGYESYDEEFSEQNFIPKTTFTYTPAGGSSGPTCTTPTTLVVSDITPHGAILTWENTDAASYTLEYKKTSETVWILLPTTETTYTLEGLTPGTAYNVRVKAVCDADLESGYKTASFTTMYGVPLIVPFSTSSIPTGWRQFTGLLANVMDGTANLTSATYGWNFGTNNGVFDSHARVNIYGTSCNKWLVTPNLLMEDNVQLSFELALTAYSGTMVNPATTGTDDRFVVLISTDNCTTWTVLREYNNSGSQFVYNELSPTPDEVAIDLSAYAGQNIAIAFYGESTVSNADNNLHIDNVSINYIPNCFKPTTLTATDINTHGATLVWNNTRAESYILEYKKASETAWTVITGITDTTYTISNLLASTTYDIRVKSFCGDEESDYRATSLTTMFGIPMIEPFGTAIPASWAMYTGMLDDVLDGTDELISATYGWNFGTGNGVFDNHARVNIYGTSCNKWLVTPTLEMENNVELSFELALTAYSGTGAHNSNCPDDRFVVLIYTESNSTWTVLREYNNSGSQFVYNNLSTTPTDVAIDLSAYAGQNIAIAFYGESTESNADNNLHIDNVSINYIPSCPKPTDVMASNISGHTADINWHANADSYLVEYRIATETSWLSTNSATNSVTLTGLAPETNYKVRVTGLCGNDSSMTSRESSFTTDVACPAPTNITVAPTDTSAVVTWHDTFNQAWKIRLVSSNVSIDSADVTDTTATFLYLTPGSDYQVVVIADCSEANDSLSVAATQAFTTLESCPAPELTVTNVTDSSATVHIGEDILGVIQSYVVTVMKGQEIVEGYEDMAVNDTVFPITGLDELSTYTVKVASVCGEDATSEYGTAPFTTKERCPDNHVCIGSGTTTNSYLPTYSYYKYNLTQQIYTAAELGIAEPKDIVSVDFYSTEARTRTLDIYMLNTSKSTFTSNTDWFVVDSNTTPLFSGSVNFTAGAWTTIEFTNPFYYNNVDSNIVLIIDDNTGSYSGNSSIFYVYSAANQSIYVYSDGTNYNPFAPSSYSGTRAAVKNRVRFGVDVHSDCRKVSNLAAGEVSPSTIELQWTENGISDSWVVAYAIQPEQSEQTTEPVEVTEEEFLTVNAGSNPFVLEGLEPETPYIIKVRSVCSDGLIKWSAPITVTTLVNCPTPTNLVVDSVSAYTAVLSWNGFSESYAIQYAEFPEEAEVSAGADTLVLHYDDGTNATNIGSSSSSTWTWGTMYPASMLEGKNVLPAVSVYENSGYIADEYTVNIYSGGDDAPGTLIATQNVTSTGTSGFHDIPLTEPVTINPFENLWITITMEGTYVMASCNTTERNNQWVNDGGTWANIGDLASSLAGYGWMIRGYLQAGYNEDELEWETVNNATSPATIEGLTRLTNYIVRVKAVCGDQQSGAAIAFFSTLPSCWPVDSLHVSARTTESITLAWTPDARNEVHETLAYIILDENGEDSYSIEAGDTPEEAIVTDLDPNTEYTFIVMTDCGNEDLSTAVRISARTACEAIDEIPATYNFENDSNYCWNFPQPENAAFITAAQYAHSDSTFLVLQGSSATDTVIAAMPHFTTEDFDPDGIMVSFYARTLQSSGHLQVGTMSDLEDTNTFVLTLDTNITSTEYGRIDASLDWDVDEESNIYVVFRLLGNGICLIDDVTLAEPSECQYVRADSIHVDSITGHTAMVTWGDILNEEGTTYTIYYMDGNERGEAVNSEPITLETLPYLMTGLEGQTEYNFEVVASCGDGYESDPTPFGFTTQTTCFPPTNLAIELVNGNGSLGTLTWTSDSTVNTWEICLNGDMEELITVTDSAVYSFENLIPDAINTVKVRALCGDEEGTSLWSTVLSFEPSNKFIIGSGTATSGVVPAHNFWKYSLTEQIYTTDELGDAGAITSIDFYKAATTNMVKDLDIYIVNTDKTFFANTSDWIPVTAGDRVYHGNVNFANNAWTTITLDQPFIYDGQSNIAIVVDNNTGAYVSTTDFLVYSVTGAGNQAIYQYSDSDNRNPLTNFGTASGVQAAKNQIRLGKAPISCWPVADLTATEIGADSVILTWTADAYDYQVSVGDSVIEDVVITTNNDTLGTIVRGLLPETEYTLTVKAVCDDGITSIGRNVTFTTQPTCLPVDSLHVVSKTDTSVVLAWQNPGIAENFIVMNEEEEYTTTVTFAGNSATVTGLEPATNYTLTVYAKCSDEDTADGRSVNFTTLASCVPVDSLMVPEETLTATSAVITWQHNTATTFLMKVNNEFIDTVITGYTYTIDTLTPERSYSIKVYALCSETDTSVEASTSFTTPATCPIVSHLTVTPTQTKALVSWDYYADAYFIVTLGNNVLDSAYQGTSYQLTGLTPETQYTVKVRAVCSADDSSYVVSKSFWTKGQCEPGLICIGSGTGNNSSYLPTYSLYNYSLTQQIYTADEIGSVDTIISVQFYNAGSAKTRDIDIYMMNTTKETFASTNDWVPATAANKVFSGEITFAANSWNTITFTTPFAYTDNNVILTVDDNTGSWESGLNHRVFETGSNQALYKYNDPTDYDPAAMTVAGTMLTKKNIVRFGYPLVITCPDVDSVHVEPAATTADITWYGDASAVAVKIYEDVLPVTISGDHVATVSGLQPEHTYTLSVYAVCDGNDTSYFAENVTFTTLPTCLPVAQLTAADSTITDNSAVISWQNPGEAASFIVMMGDSVLNDAYTETSYTLSDLVADTTYTITVYAVCSEDDTAHPVTMTFATKPSCLPVATLTLSDTTAHSIVISWESEASAFAMVVNNEYITDENIASPYTLTGLESETWYSVAVYAICGNDTTPYAATARFMTPPSCYPVTNLTVVDSTNTGNSVVITWVSDAPNFAVMVNNVFITDENIASPYTLTGLNPETQYTVKVYAVCDDNDTAKTAPQVSFTTPDVCPEGMVCIGEGTTTNSYLPTYTYYNYSLTQQIYTAEEIGAAANILSVDIYNGGSTKTRNIDVYMVNTTKTAFADNYDWEPVTEANLVYSGEVTFTAGQWNTITFATPFAYDGQSNVILAVDDNTGDWSSGFAGRVFNTTSEQALRVYSDNTNYDPTDPSNYSGTTMDVKNRVRFAVTPLFTNFDVTVSVNPENAGTVTSEPETLTELAAGTEVTLTATAAEGYRFVNWTIDNEEVDNQLTYTFAVEANVDVVANFEELLPGTIYDTINASSADPTMGSVTADVALGQPVAEGTEVTLTAVPATCHTFVAWMENNELVSEDAVYTFTVTGNRTLVATFEAVVTTVADEPVTACDSYIWNGETYTTSQELSVTLQDVNGCDSIATLSLTINNAQTVELDAVTACDSYEWNGQTYTQSGNLEFTTEGANGCDSTTTLSLTINNSVVENVNLTGETEVVFNNETFTADTTFVLHLTAANECDSTVNVSIVITGVPVITYTVNVTYDATMGSVTGMPETETVEEGYQLSLTATANDGYEFVNWTVNNETVEGATYSTIVNSDLNITANFQVSTPVINYYTVSVSSADATMGSATATYLGQVAENTEDTAYATAVAGYHFIGWMDATGATVSTANPYIFTVTSDVTLIANFELLPVESTIAASEITYWVGTGNNQAVMAINWANAAYAWGVRFSSDSITVQDALDTIKNHDSRFNWTTGDWGLGDITFNEGQISLSGTSAWEQKLNNEYGSGLAQNVGNGDFVKWADDADGIAIDSTYYPGYGYWYNNVYTRTILPMWAPQVVPPTTYTVTVNVNDATMGSVTSVPETLTGIEAGTSVTLTAVANDGYEFVNWTDATGAALNATNPYTFTVTEDMTLTANFQAVQSALTVTFATNDATMGTTYPAPGTYTYQVDDTVWYSAIATTGYYFQYWVMTYTYQGMVINDTTSAADIEGGFLVSGIMNFGINHVDMTAYFGTTQPAVDSVEVTYAVNDATMGTITPSGVQMLAVGQQLTASATANEGYELYAWNYKVYRNGTVVADTTFETTETEVNFGTIPQRFADYDASITITAMFRQNVGIEDVDMSNVSIYSANSTIYVKGAEGKTIHIYDLNGRTVVTKTNAAETMAIPMAETGVYLVRVGNAAAKRVMLMR